MREIDFSKEPDTLFKESIEAFNNNDYDKSLLILQYLNYIIPNNNNIISNLTAIYFKTHTDPITLATTNFHIENNRINKHTFQITIHKPIDVSETEKEISEIEIMTKIHNLISNWINHNPESWLWQHNRWT